jgi:hypothetical protein
MYWSQTESSKWSLNCVSTRSDPPPFTCEIIIRQSYIDDLCRKQIYYITIRVHTTVLPPLPTPRSIVTQSTFPRLDRFAPTPYIDRPTSTTYPINPPPPISPYPIPTLTRSPQANRKASPHSAEKVRQTTCTYWSVGTYWCSRSVVVPSSCAYSMHCTTYNAMHMIAVGLHQHASVLLLLLHELRDLKRDAKRNG